MLVRRPTTAERDYRKNAKALEIIFAGDASLKHQQRRNDAPFLSFDINAIMNWVKYFAGLGRKLRMHYICIIKSHQAPEDMGNYDRARQFVVYCHLST